jgi:2-dehydro-3-deoxyglucarate aldolase/4-hydroxy-2-oxoheptanedioate aldolase
MVVEFWTRGIAKMLEAAQVDFVIFDMEHTGWTYGDLADQLLWMKATPLTPIVRPATGDYHHISRALDCGAQGVMIPRVENAAEVREIVQAVKYPPQGRRGVSFSIAHDDYKIGDVGETMRSANEETLVIIQIEKVSAVEEIDEILSIPGVDIAWPGQYDLSASMGITGQVTHPDLLAALDRVVAACDEHGKIAGIQPITVEQGVEWRGRGFRCISFSEDMLVYLDALTRNVSTLRAELNAAVTTA